jgi:hypothetical protein
MTFTLAVFGRRSSTHVFLGTILTVDRARYRADSRPLAARWVEVRDAQGNTRLEARWGAPADDDHDHGQQGGALPTAARDDTRHAA